MLSKLFQSFSNLLSLEEPGIVIVTETVNLNSHKLSKRFFFVLQDVLIILSAVLASILFENHLKTFLRKIVQYVFKLVKIHDAKCE